MKNKKAKITENQQKNPQTPQKTPPKSESYPGFDENMFPTPEKSTLPPANIRPFTKYRAVEMGLCVAAIILGLLYLYTEAVTLTLLLPAFSIGMTVITVLRFQDGREALAKNKTTPDKIAKTTAYFPAIFSAFMTIIVIIVTITYFTGASK